MSVPGILVKLGILATMFDATRPKLEKEPPDTGATRTALEAGHDSNKQYLR